MRQKCNLVLREAYRRLEDCELRAAEGGGQQILVNT